MYQRIKLNLSSAQQKKALRGAPIRIKADQIGVGYIIMLHPANYKRLVKAKQGVILDLSPGEMIATASFHKLIPDMTTTGVEGSGLFDSIWSGLKSVGRFVRDSGIGTILADVAQEAATPFLGETGAKLARNVVKGVTGVGLKPKRTKKSKKTTGAGLYL
jgi:hypothetical protein